MLICLVTDDCVVVLGGERLSEGRGRVLRLLLVLESLQLETPFYCFALHLVSDDEIEFASVFRHNFYTEGFHFTIVLDKSAHFNGKY